jgi:DNA-binding response OmpR family regulator
MRILVVEDVRRLADDIAEGLRDEGMAVDIAYDGLAAAAKINLNPYDVLVLDRDLPGVHGDVICRMVGEGENPPMVLMLTAADSPGERVAGLSLGADDYLPKPFHFPELVLRVRALARRKPAARGPVYRAGGIELDGLRRTVTRDGDRVELSVKEFGVLEALLQTAHGTGHEPRRAEPRFSAPTPPCSPQLLLDYYQMNTIVSIVCENATVTSMDTGNQATRKEIGHGRDRDPGVRGDN